MRHFKDKGLLISALVTTALTAALGVSLYGALGTPAQAYPMPSPSLGQPYATGAVVTPSRAS